MNKRDVHWISDTAAMDVEGGRKRRRKKGREDNHFRSHGDDDDVSLSDYLITLDSTPGAVVLLELGGGMEAGPPR